MISIHNFGNEEMAPWVCDPAEPITQLISGIWPDRSAIKFLARKRALSNYLFGFNIKQSDLVQVELYGDLLTQME
jgi:hypothetical protein